MSENVELPQPRPALRRLDRLVGRWGMEGNLVGSDEKNIRGETTFRWVVGGFFLEQRVQCRTGTWTRRLRAHGARTERSRAAGGRTPARTRR